MRRGAAGREQAEAAAEASAERRSHSYSPFRFRLGQGEDADIIILDEWIQNPQNPDDGVPFIYEHHLRGDDGKWQTFESCPKDFANCVLCDSGKHSYHAMYLTVLDMRPYTNKRGEVVPYSRKLLRVKTGSPVFDTLTQINDIAVEEFGTLRGCHIVLARDNTGKDANTGTPKLMAEWGGRLFEMVSEEDLISEFGHPEVRGEQNTVLKPENGDLYPYDYPKVFHRPDPERLRRVYGAGQTQAGSAQETASEWGEPDDGPYAAEGPATEVQQQASGPAAAAGSRVRTRSRAATAATPQQAPAATPSAGRGVSRMGRSGAAAPGPVRGTRQF